MFGCDAITLIQNLILGRAAHHGLGPIDRGLSWEFDSSILKLAVGIQPPGALL